MPLSTFAARTFRADSYIAPLSQQRPEVVQPVEQKPAGGIILPFKRRAETPEILIEIKGLWAVEQPQVVVPPVLYRAPVYTSVDVEIAPVVYPKPLPEIQRSSASVATPQFLSYAEYNVGNVTSGATLPTLTANALVESSVNLAMSGATVTPSIDMASGMHKVLPPVTVRNPTDEELVLIALDVL